MSQNLVVNGVTYPYPDVGDENWGQDATDWAVAVTAGMLQKAGGSFTLTAEVDFGANFGLKSLYYKSRTANPASSGQIRLGNTDVIAWRNAAHGADLSLTVNASDVLTWNSSVNIDSNTLVVDAANNRVGVATASPSVPLDVTGAGKFSGSVTISASSGNVLIVDTNTLIADATNNRIGIGTATPLDVLVFGDGTDFISGGPLSVGGYAGFAKGNVNVGTTNFFIASDATSVNLNAPDGSTGVISFSRGNTSIGLFTIQNELVIGDNSADGQLAASSGEFQARRVGANAKMRTQTLGTAHQCYFAMDRARGTFASPTALQSGDVFGSLIGVGCYGSTSTFSHGPEISLKTTENWSVTNLGSAIDFYTVVNGSASQTVIMSLGVGGANAVELPIAGTKLTVGVSSAQKTLHIKDSVNTNTAQFRMDNSTSVSHAYAGNFADSFYLTAGGTYASGWTSDNASRAIAAIVLASGDADSNIVFQTKDANNTAPTTRLTIAKDGGLTVAAATGGSKGSGTINVAGDLYKNNTAYANPDYVLEAYFNGEISLFKKNPGASEYTGLLALDDLRAYLMENLDLPGVKARFRDANGAQGVFARADIALEKIEEAHIYILELHERIKRLEGAK